MNSDDDNGGDTEREHEQPPELRLKGDRTSCFFRVRGVCCNSQSTRRNTDVSKIDCERCEARKPFP